MAELDPVSFRSTHCYRHSSREILIETTARRLLPLKPTGGGADRLKGIAESRVLSGGVTCAQKCPGYSSQGYCQLSGTCLWLSRKKGWGNKEEVSKRAHAVLPCFRSSRLAELHAQRSQLRHSELPAAAAAELGLGFQKPCLLWTRLFHGSKVAGGDAALGLWLRGGPQVCILTILEGTSGCYPRTGQGQAGEYTQV